jgi:hypothetical protein
MSIDIKLSGQLYKLIIQDLVRPHSHAKERVGFCFGRLGSAEGTDKIVLLNRYHPVPDEQYVYDPTVGARIGADTMTWAMQEVYRGRASNEGIFHVHLHGHLGETRMSVTDSRELPRLIPGFQSVGREAPHGIIIFSRNHGTGWVWLPGANAAIQVSTISVIGSPVAVFARRGAR